MASTSAWIKPNTGWADFAGALERRAEMVPSIAKAVATEIAVPAVQESIMNDPTVNGEHDPDRDYTGIVPRITVFDSTDGLYVGIPGSDPAAQEAHEMEYGTHGHGPAPHLRKAVSVVHAEASRAFYERLVNG